METFFLYLKLIISCTYIIKINAKVEGTFSRLKPAISMLRNDTLVYIHHKNKCHWSNVPIAD